MKEPDSWHTQQMTKQSHDLIGRYVRASASEVEAAEPTYTERAGWVKEIKMKWTDKDETKWKQLTERREKNRAEVGKLAFIRQLREMADAVEGGKQELGEEINIEYVRAEAPYGWEGHGPVIGRRITVYMPNAAPQTRRDSGVV